MSYKEEAASHEHEHVDVVWIASGLISWELIVSKLDDRDLHSIVDIGHSISFVVNVEFEYTQSPWGLKLVSERW